MDQNKIGMTSTPLTPETPQPLGAVSDPQMGMSIGSAPGASGTPPVIPPPIGQGLPPELPQADLGNKSGGKKMMMIGIIVILLLLLGAGGYYYTTMMNTEVEEEVETPVQPDHELTLIQTETEQIEISDPETDLSGIDQEISSLEATPSAR